MLDRYRPLLRRAARRLAPRNGAVAADDLMQVGAIAVLQSARRMDPAAPGFTAYLVMRVKGAMIDELRRQHGRTALVADGPAEAVLADAADQGSTPLDVLEAVRLEAALGAGIAGLPRLQRAVLQLAFDGGLSPERIGAALGISASQARRHRDSAVASLRTALAAWTA